MTTLSVNPAPTLVPIYIRLVLMAALWAGTFVAGRIVSLEIPPLLAAIGRFGLAVVGLLFLAKWQEGGLPRLSLRQAVVTFFLGVTGVFLYNLLFLAALSELPASRTATFVAFGPVVVALIMVGSFQERLSAIRWIGVSLTMFGALLIISRGDLSGMASDLGRSLGRGEVSMILAVIFWAFYTIIGRRALADMSALAATTYAAMWGLALLVVAQLISQPQIPVADISLQSVAAIVYLAIGGTVVPFVWYYRGVAEIGPARTSVFTNFVPAFGVLFGVVLLGEPLLISMLIGGAFVICGVTLTNRE